MICHVAFQQTLGNWLRIWLAGKIKSNSLDRNSHRQVNCTAQPIIIVQIRKCVYQKKTNPKHFVIERAQHSSINRDKEKQANTHAKGEGSTKSVHDE